MNERLTELYRSCRPKEALASQDEFKSANVLLGSEVAKFAELIVRECVECADIVGKSNLASGYPNSTAHHVKQKIREHFGVTE
jgi:hypothetical protein